MRPAWYAPLALLCRSFCVTPPSPSDVLVQNGFANKDTLFIPENKARRMINSDETHQKMSNECEQSGARAHTYTDTSLGGPSAIRPRCN